MGSEPNRNNMGPKSYRIYRIYKFIFNSCVEVFGKRSPLALALIEAMNDTDKDIIGELPTYTKGQLIEVMIDSLKKHEKPLSELRYLTETPRIKELLSIMDEYGVEWGGVRVFFALRILPVYRTYIEQYSDSAIGEVLEVAVANFLNEITEFEFDLVKKTFTYMVKNEKE